MNIVLASNEICKILESAEYIDVGSMNKTIFNYLDIELLYQLSDFSIHVREEMRTEEAVLDHKMKFVSSLLLKYMNMKSKQISYRITIEEQNEEIKRRKSRKTAILTGKSRYKK